MMDKKAFAISKTISENNITEEEVASLFRVIGRLTAEDRLKMLWMMTGAASTMKAIHDEKAK